MKSSTKPAAAYHADEPIARERRHARLTEPGSDAHVEQAENFSETAYTFDVSSLSGLTNAYQVSSDALVVETKEGREVRITVKRDLRSGAFSSEYERRMPISKGDRTYEVWTRTNAHQACTGADVHSCLEAAIREVSDGHLY